MLLVLALAAAPPPPAPPLESISAPVDGYDLQTPYQVWSRWVEAQKGAATEAVLAVPDDIDGEQPFGEPIIRFEKFNDFGHFLTGEIRAYCPVSNDAQRRPRNCHYRLRRAYIEGDAGGYDQNPVARWMRDSFNAARLVAHFRASGLAPDTDWWMVDRARLFSVLPSAVPMLVENATVVRLDSRECPALGRAITRIESRQLNWSVDLQTVQPDRQMTTPWPHAIRIVYTLRTLASGADEAVTIRGNGRDLRNIIHPILDIADECERRRSNAPGTGSP